MGFFKDLFFKKEDEKTAIEKKAEEQIKAHPQEYAQATKENIPLCNACGQDIENKPRIMKHMGKILYFHKKCIKKMARGELPMPSDPAEKEEKDL
jgi:hypothetical protein